MTEPFALACHCGFSSTDPQTFVDHCLITQHITLPVEMGNNDLAEWIQALSTIQKAMANPDAELPSNAEVRPISLDEILLDEDLPDEAKRDILIRLEEIRKREDED